MPGCQKITNDGLTQSGTGCFIAVPIMATVGVKGLIACGDGGGFAVAELYLLQPHLCQLTVDECVVDR